MNSYYVFNSCPHCNRIISEIPKDDIPIDNVPVLEDDAISDTLTTYEISGNDSQSSMLLSCDEIMEDGDLPPPYDVTKETL